LTSNLLQIAMFNPIGSGYGDAMGMGAEEEAQADADKLTGSIDASSLWITRLHAELTRTGLGKDLQLQASTDQTQVSNVIQTVLSIGKTPACPVYDCGPSTPGGGFFGNGNGVKVPTKSGGCSIGQGSSSSTSLTGLALVAALALLRRRR